MIINQKIYIYIVDAGNNTVSLFTAGTVRADGLDLSDEGESLYNIIFFLLLSF